ncbi:MAG TPA: hypothetical protein VKL61_02720 [Candidatus Polarisedimenticolia bacterium]|nr:hypothetical protein [Candidatus Polarisedimenticolia bacterium]
MMTGNDCARFTLPVDPTLEKILPRATRSYLRLHHLPPPSARFILGRVVEATRKLIRPRREPPVRLWVTFRHKAGRVQVEFRVVGTPSGFRGLASLARNAPDRVEASYRPTRRGGTLRFTTSGLRENG